MDIGLAQLDRLVAHHVGNRTREEGITLSNSEPVLTRSISDIILKDYLGRVKSSAKDFAFYHESDVGLNEILVYASEIFQDEHVFLRAAEKIARHLYSKSTHPNVAGGDLFVMLFSGLRIGDKETRAIGLFKAEAKEKYLSVVNESGALVLRDNEGIDPRDVQKAALIIEEGLQVLAAERGNSPTAYWVDDFLKARPVATAKSSAQYVSKIVKATVQELSEPSKVSEYKEQFQALLASELPTLEGLLEINSRFVGEERSEEIVDIAASSMGLRIASGHHLDQKAVQNATRSAFKKIRIASGIELLVSGKSLPTAIRTEPSKDGRRITIIIDIGDAR